MPRTQNDKICMMAGILVFLLYMNMHLYVFMGRFWKKKKGSLYVALRQKFKSMRWTGRGLYCLSSFLHILNYAFKEFIIL